MTPDGSNPVTNSLDRRSTVALVVITLAVFFLYRTVVPKLFRDLWNDPNFSHGLIVPFFSGYLIWQRRDQLRRHYGKGTDLPSILMVGCGTILLVVGKAAGEYFTMELSLVFVACGLFRAVFGKEGFRECRFPLGFLIFMIPIPYLIYDRFALPLKFISSAIAEHALGFLGLPVLREGNLLHMANLQMEVVDACSGIRSLLSLLAIASALGYMLSIGIAGSGILLLLTFPVSILTNSIRLVGTGILSVWYGSRATEGLLHELSGLLLFLSGAVIVAVLAIAIRKFRGEVPVKRDPE